jgi:hypothetical protein
VRACVRARLLAKAAVAACGCGSVMVVRLLVSVLEAVVMVCRCGVVYVRIWRVCAVASVWVVVAVRSGCMGVGSCGDT